MESLTPREREVAELVARGLRNEAIASQLGISRDSVIRHLNRLYLRLGLDGKNYEKRMTLARMIWELGHGNED